MPDVRRNGLTPNNTFFLQVDVGGASQSPGARVISWWTNVGANQEWDWVPVDPIDGLGHRERKQRPVLDQRRHPG